MTDTGSDASNAKSRIWLDGKLVAWEEANVHVMTHGLHYGTGVFEGVRAYETAEGPAIFRLADHTRRLLDSAKIVGMKIPYTQEQLSEAQIEVLAASGYSSAYIRPIAFYDDSSLGLEISKHGVRVAIAAIPWGAYLGSEALEKGIKVGVSSYRRHHPGISMCHAKVTGNYINSVLARQEATANGYDEALMLDNEGFVSEGSGENLFIVNDGRLQTPAIHNALDGITRRTVIALAADRGMEVEVRRLARDDLYIAEEAFFTGTAAEVTPISSFDGRRIGAGSRGPVTARLQEDYFACVSGQIDAHADWLTVASARGRKAA